MKPSDLLLPGLLPLLLLAPPLVPPAVASDTLLERSEVVVAPVPWKVLEVENRRGSIEVRRGAPGTIRLVALKTVRAMDRRRSTELARHVEVSTEREGDRFTVTVHYPARSEVRIGFWDLLCGVGFPRAEVRLVIEAPEGMPIRLHSSSGDLMTEDRGGPQTLETRSGDIAVHGARGTIAATTSSGDIEATDVRSAQLQTSSGDITLGLRGPLASTEAATSSGDIRVLLTPGLGCALELRTSSGDLDVGVPLVPGTMGRHLITGTVAGGGARVTLRTSSGDINVENGGS